MRKFLMITLVITAICLAAFFGIKTFSSQSSEKNNPASESEIVQSILDKWPSLASEGKPMIEVYDTKIIEQIWYVVRIKSVNEKNVSVPVTVLLIDTKDSRNTMNVILGPDTHFTESELLRYNVPDSVIMELRKS